MLGIEIRHVYGRYKEIKIDTIDTQTSVGLLDDAESLDMAKLFISAAEDLLPSEYSDQDLALAKIRESL